MLHKLVQNSKGSFDFTTFMLHDSCLSNHDCWMFREHETCLSTVWPFVNTVLQVVRSHEQQKHNHAVSLLCCVLISSSYSLPQKITLFSSSSLLPPNLPESHLLHAHQYHSLLLIIAPPWIYHTNYTYVLKLCTPTYINRTF